MPGGCRPALSRGGSLIPDGFGNGERSPRPAPVPGWHRGAACGAEVPGEPPAAWPEVSRKTPRPAGERSRVFPRALPTVFLAGEEEPRAAAGQGEEPGPRGRVSGSRARPRASTRRGWGGRAPRRQEIPTVPPPFPCQGRANLVTATCQSQEAPGHPRHGPGGVARAPPAPVRPRSPSPRGPPGRASSLTALLCPEPLYHGEGDSESRCPDPAVRLRRNRRRLVSSRRVRGRGEAASTLQPCQIPGMHARAGSCAPPPRPLRAGVGLARRGDGTPRPPLPPQSPPAAGTGFSAAQRLDVMAKFGVFWLNLGQQDAPIAAPKWCHQLAATLNCAQCWA